MVGRLYTNPMQLLISVRNPYEARSALDGGADIIDAKEPEAGPLGPVSTEMFGAIVESVGGRAPVSAALDDACDEAAVDEHVRAFARLGAAFVKVGFAGRDRQGHVSRLVAAACRGTADTATAVVAVAYADFATANSLSPDLIAAAAATGGARGVLIDTARKDGQGLPQLIGARHLREWVHRVQSAGLFVALAGQLRASDLSAMAACNADIVGVRGAACESGRTGTISEARVRALSTHLRARTGSMRPNATVVAMPGRSNHPREPVPMRPRT